MNRQFDPFEYQLNLNSSKDRSSVKANAKNSSKAISILITPFTNLKSVAKKFCLENHLSVDLVEILAASIQEEVQKQVMDKERSKSYSSINSSFIEQSRAKSIKNNWSSCMNESSEEDVSNVSPLNNSKIAADASIMNTSEEEEYSFRPATYMKMLDMTNNDEDSKSLSVDEFSLGQSYSSINWSSKQSILSNNKPLIVKKDRNVFDNLYEHSKALEWKKEFQRKKSFQKLSFKPQINSMSKKIIQLKKQNNPEYSSIIQRSSTKQHIKEKSPFFSNKNHSKNKCSASQTPKKSIKQLVSQKQNRLPIYDRGMIYRKKSQQKLFGMKKQQIIDEIKACTFKPKLNIDEPSKKTKSPSSSFYKLY